MQTRSFLFAIRMGFRLTISVALRWTSSIQESLYEIHDVPFESLEYNDKYG